MPVVSHEEEKFKLILIRIFYPSSATRLIKQKQIKLKEKSVSPHVKIMSEPQCT